MTFKVRDRVSVYGWVQMFNLPYKPRGGGNATVVYICNDNEIHVQFDNANNGETGGDKDRYMAHPKQCRLLKKKERRRFWIYQTIDNIYWVYTVQKILPGYKEIEVVEVRRKKETK